MVADEVVPPAADAAPRSPPKETLRRSESLLELVKRKLHMQPATQREPPAALSSAVEAAGDEGDSASSSAAAGSGAGAGAGASAGA